MSYGTNAPQGLQPRQYLNGTPWTGQVSPYSIQSGYNASIFSGDPVYVNAGGYIQLAIAGANNAASGIIGVFYGVKYVDTTGTSQTLPYWAANTVTQGGLNAEGFVIDDYNVLYDIQSSNVAVNQGALNATANLVAGAGSTRTGQSGWAVGAANNTAGDQVRLIRFTPNPVNLSVITNAGASANFANYLVLLNNDPYKGAIGLAGV